MTETLCNPEYSRSRTCELGLTTEMNELLFEAYRVPSVNYGLDALFAGYANNVREDGLLVSAGRNTTLVVPLVGGRGILDNAKRYVCATYADSRGAARWAPTFCTGCCSSNTQTFRNASRRLSRKRCSSSCATSRPTTTPRSAR